MTEDATKAGTRTPVVSTPHLIETLQDMTRLMAEVRRQQMEMEAYATVTRLALGALLRAVPAEARAQVAARLREPALMGEEETPLAKAVAEEAARMADALAPPLG
jgi:hypothetical protein